MMNVITEELQLSFDGDEVPIKYTTISIAKGFQCPMGYCGLCCLTETEGASIAQEIGVMPFKGIERCRAFDPERKICTAYGNRPVGCRIYPFMAFYSPKEIIFSPSLGCPFVSDKSKYYGAKEIVHLIENDALLRGGVQDNFKVLSSRHNELVRAFNSKLNYKNEASISQISFEEVLKIVENAVAQATPDELLNDPKSWIRDCYIEAYSKCEVDPNSVKNDFINDAKKMKILDIDQIALYSFKGEGKGAYIKPMNEENENPSIIIYKVKKGNKLEIKNIINDEIWRMPLYNFPSDLEMDSDVHEQFLAYAKLLMVRKPFAQLYPELHFHGFPLHDYLDKITSQIEIMAILSKVIAARDKIERIDSETFREILSWCDAKFHGLSCGLFRVTRAI